MSASAEVEPVALAIRDHQAAVEEWLYASLARELHRWVGVFDLEFKLNLPSYPVLRFSPIRNAYATFVAARTDLGTKDNVTFNTHELPTALPPLLATLCHELLHLWQEYHGNASKSNYHNTGFREKAHACGLVVDKRGCHTGYTDIFTSLLAKHGLETQALHDELALSGLRLYGAGKRPLKMRKWSCACPTNVRCATELDATCNRCRQTFRLAGPKG